MLAVLTTHPIQYQVPIWKGLAARRSVPLKVFYLSDQGLKARFDPGFCKYISWDIDLLAGYDCEFLGRMQPGQSGSFWELRLKRGFGRALRQMGVEVFTYIPMAGGFVYLAVVLDWFSRRVLSWRLSIIIALQPKSAWCH
jgi:transposase InsO family protein